MGSNRHAVQLLVGGILTGLLGCTSTGKVLETKAGEPSPSNDGGVKGGTRHRPRPRRPAGWWNRWTRLSFGEWGACHGRFRRRYAAEGEHAPRRQTRRRLPARAGRGRTAAVLPIPTTNTFYQDANCTTPILVESTPVAGACPSAIAVTSYQSAVECPPPPVRVIMRGAPIARPPMVYGWRLGLCVIVTDDESDSSVPEYYETVAAPPSDWVVFTNRAIAPVTSSLSREVWHGEDGSVLDGTMQLGIGDRPCDPVALTYNELVPRYTNYCVPTARRFESTGGFFCRLRVCGQDDNSEPVVHSAAAHHGGPARRHSTDVLDRRSSTTPSATRSRTPLSTPIFWDHVALRSPCSPGRRRTCAVISSTWQPFIRR